MTKVKIEKSKPFEDIDFLKLKEIQALAEEGFQEAKELAAEKIKETIVRWTKRKLRGFIRYNPYTKRSKCPRDHSYWSKDWGHEELSCTLGRVNYQTRFRSSELTVTSGLYRNLLSKEEIGQIVIQTMKEIYPHTKVSYTIQLGDPSIPEVAARVHLHLLGDKANKKPEIKEV